MSRKKKEATPWVSWLRARELYDKAVTAPNKAISKAIETYTKKLHKIDADIARIVTKTLKSGFVDCKLSGAGELVVEVSPRNLDPLFQARKLMKATGANKLCFLINHEIREVQ